MENGVLDNPRFCMVVTSSSHCSGVGTVSGMYSARTRMMCMYALFISMFWVMDWQKRDKMTIDEGDALTLRKELAGLGYGRNKVCMMLSVSELQAGAR